MNVRQAPLILVTGLPGTGKSTLARVLAKRYRLPLICKDSIKEPLMDVFSTEDRAQSRRLSNASFTVMFSLARDCLAAGAGLILEGNFRPGEHEAELMAIAASVRIAQVICRAAEPVRIARLKARANDLSRHPGHHDADFVGEHAPPPTDILSLTSEHFVFDTDSVRSLSDGLARLQPLLDDLDRWCQTRAADV